MQLLLYNFKYLDGPDPEGKHFKTAESKVERPQKSHLQKLKTVKLKNTSISPVSGAIADATAARVMHFEYCYCLRRDVGRAGGQSALSMDQFQISNSKSAPLLFVGVANPRNAG